MNKAPKKYEKAVTDILAGYLAKTGACKIIKERTQALKIYSQVDI